VQALEAYSWPGNVRELENVIARAAVISRPPFLQLPERWNQYSDLSPRNRGPALNSQAHEDSKNVNPIREPLAALERTHILEILRQTSWRIEGPKGAALILGLHPNTLRSRMQKLGIQRPSRDKADLRQPVNKSAPIQ
jgi:DNA-binding NtrC family response regulator